MNKVGLDNLRIAIVEQAVKDYRRSMDKFEIEAIEHFFLGSWFKMLVDIDGDYLVRKLREEKHID